jgi:hypothetical protein
VSRRLVGREDIVLKGGVGRRGVVPFERHHHTASGYIRQHRPLRHQYHALVVGNDAARQALQDDALFMHPFATMQAGGPAIFPDWNEADTLDACRRLLFAGIGTTTHALVNACTGCSPTTS